MPLLPPEFVKVDPTAIEANLISRYEDATGKVLYPAQVERLFINQIAYSHSLALSAIQHAGEQLLVRFSRGPILDYLGELVGTPRLLSRPASCWLVFSITEPRGTALTIRAGTRVASSDGTLAFATTQSVTIEAGQLTVRVRATCTAPGSSGNGWAVGQIGSLVAPIEGVSVVNDTVPAGGADEEDDDPYRERIILAPEAYTNAGSRGAYRYHAMAVDQSIIDVEVHGPSEGQPAGQVALYPLTSSGLPGDDLLERIAALVSGERVRPLNDTVRVLRPVEVVYVIRAHVTLYSTADRATAMQAAQRAADAYASERRAGLGRDLVPEQISTALQVAGVYRARVETPALRSVQGNEWANCEAIELIYAGVSDG